MSTTTAPDRTEATEYYFSYIDQVGSGEICWILDTQCAEALTLLGTISEPQSLTRYAADKWTIRELVGHLNDTERLFLFRAWWFARGFDTPLPSFAQHVAVAAAGANQRSLASLAEEFRVVRAATLSFFTVRALAYLAAGHVTHHLKVLRSRYLSAPHQ